jgi:hypothetical protein
MGTNVRNAYNIIIKLHSGGGNESEGPDDTFFGSLIYFSLNRSGVSLNETILSHNNS